jgi:hypothetical protein
MELEETDDRRIIELLTCEENNNKTKERLERKI